MKFEPKPDGENPNVDGRTHPLSDFLILGSAALGLILVLGLVLMFVGESVVARMSTETEDRIFKNFQWGLPTEPWPEGKVILRKLVAEKADRFSVSIWCSEVPNALAVPGGGILVSTGLLELVSSENAVAFVLGHEFGHFLQRDHLRLLGRSVGFGLAAALLGFDSSASWLVDVGGGLIQRSYQRSQERGADLIAVDLMRNAYGGLAGAGEFFEKMGEREGALVRGASFLSTHPAPDERLETLAMERDQGAILPLVKPPPCQP